MKELHEYDFKGEWVKYARYMYGELNKLEDKNTLDIENSFKSGQPYLNRKYYKDKIKNIIIIKKELVDIVKGIDKAKFIIDDYTFEKIDKHGFESYFALNYPHIEQDVPLK